jgi:DNA mismatch repair protein MutS2
LIYPDNFEELIGFSPIREQLKECCRLPSSQEKASNFKVMVQWNDVNDALDMLDECKSLVEERPSLFEWSQPADLFTILRHVKIDGYFLSELELLGVVNNIDIHEKFVSVLHRFQEEFPHFWKCFGSLEGDISLSTSIRKAIDTEGILKQDASPNYQKISTEIRRLEKEVRQQTKSVFKEWKDLGFTADTEITIREERLVISVIAEFKRKVKGFVKDVSATGKVLFIEPASIVEFNNRLKELYAEQRREREKILKTLTSQIKPYKSELLHIMDALTSADFVFAKYQLSKQYEAERPKHEDRQVLELKNAFHPILKRELQKQNNKMIPLDLNMGNQRLVVVSGPNAGGKSVVLKTTLLLQYWLQSGFFVTADPNSIFGAFEYFGIDCGDGQSIEEGLSTFSAHLKHLKSITESAHGRALIGLDELGTGTDPRYGAPIAQVILEQLLRSKAMVIATTHFSQIREWGNNESAVMQSAMAYDAVNLKPLYKFIQGKPGSSFALELMRKTGFEHNWLERINEIAGKELGKTEDLMLDLEKKNQELEHTLNANLKKSAHLQEMLEEYARLKEKIADKRKLAVDQTRLEMQQLFQEANRQIEQTIRIIQENKADKQKTSKARQKLKSIQGSLEKRVASNAEQAPNQKKEVEESKQFKPIDVKKLLPGYKVKTKDSDQTGEIVEIKKKKALVAFGLIKMWVDIQELTESADKTAKKSSGTRGFSWVQRQSSFKGQLDLRGVRTEDAKGQLTKFLDEAYALGQNPVKIVHGRGDGILRKMLRDHLKQLNYVKEYENEHTERGGDGCTIVYLN